jgi:hypothetical protein
MLPMTNEVLDFGSNYLVLSSLPLFYNHLLATFSRNKGGMHTLRKYENKSTGTHFFITLWKSVLQSVRKNPTHIGMPWKLTHLVVFIFVISDYHLQTVQESQAQKLSCISFKIWNLVWTLNHFFGTDH